MLLLCELLLHVGFVAMNNFFFINALSLDFFGWVASPWANIVNSSLVYIIEQKVLKEKSTEI